MLLNVGDRQLAEELVAEAFARAWVSWRKVRAHSAPRAWVVRTALNTHVTWWRRRREVVLGDHDIAIPTTQGTAISSDLLAELRRLPLRQRQVVTLRLLGRPAPGGLLSPALGAAVTPGSSPAAAITAALAAAAASHGCTCRSKKTTRRARALYARSGFTDHHGYHYRIAPAGS